ncbi:MAG: hypothetical protein ACWGQW_15710, partial [bacterium]
AENDFIAMIQENFGKTEEEARIAFNAYREADALILDPIGGTYKVKHGLYLDPDIVDNAIKLGTPEEPVPPVVPERPPMPEEVLHPRHTENLVNKYLRGEYGVEPNPRWEVKQYAAGEEIPPELAREALNARRTAPGAERMGIIRHHWREQPARILDRHRACGRVAGCHTKGIVAAHLSGYR